MRDVTQEQELEERRKAFISIASHELRTPLTTIIGFSEILFEKDVSRATRQKWLESIHKDSLHLSDVVDDLLNVSRIQSGKISANSMICPLKPVVEETISLVKGMTDRHKFMMAIPSYTPAVWADREKLIQVITNLLTNAVKYSPAGGRITVTAKHDPEKDCTVVSVTDEGIGTARGDQPVVFESFSRIYRHETEGTRGAGLGLYIVKSFVEPMGGEVWVEESQVNKGSTFSFSLEIASQAVRV